MVFIKIMRDNQVASCFAESEMPVTMPNLCTGRRSNPQMVKEPFL